jgi:filamentous hemagglutinin
VSFQIQHNFENSQSIISSGRDFKFDIERSSSTGAVINRVQKLEVSGPGELSVLAGRDIDLGSSQGVTTVGNQVNPTLAEDGASIDMLSGLTGTNIDIAGFTEKYFRDHGQFGEVYVQAAIEHMQVLTGSDTLSKSDALEAFHKLTPVQRAHFNARFFAPIRNVFNELVENQGKKFSIAKNSFDNTTDDDERFAFKQEMDSAQLEVLAAIESLFPGTTVLADNDSFTIDPENGIVFKDGNDADSIIVEAYSQERDLKFNGDISMFFSRVHSTDGGDINLYAPNGGINAGLAVSSGGARDASLLGIVAVKQGDIHSVVRDDFQVNTTRVMTLGGGDIVIGSTDGNIDAGRGAKTALAAPPPIVRFDERGNFIVELPPAVAGSGIRANVAPDGTQGDALLFALQGIIDASEAGVGGKDVTVGATAIVGSDNIDVGGVSIGVPAASTGSIAAGLGNVGNVAAAVAQAVESSADNARDTSDKMASAAALGILSIDIVGFGDEEIE